MPQTHLGWTANSQTVDWKFPCVDWSGISPQTHHRQGDLTMETPPVYRANSQVNIDKTWRTFTSSDAERGPGEQSTTPRITQITVCFHYSAQTNTTTAWEPTQSISDGATLHNWVGLWMGFPVRHNFCYLCFMFHGHTLTHPAVPIRTWPVCLYHSF